MDASYFRCHGSDIILLQSWPRVQFAKPYQPASNQPYPNVLMTAAAVHSGPILNRILANIK